MKKIERLSALAAERADPRPLDAASVMARLRDARIENDDGGVLSMPMNYFMGGAAAAAAVAAAVGTLAVMAWMDISNPFSAVESLLDITEYML